MRLPFFLITALALPAAARAADVVTYLPADTDAVLTIQVRQLTETDLMYKIGADLMKDALRASKPAAAAVEATGLDALKDFERITVGMNMEQTSPPKPFALFEGKFDVKKVEDSIAAYMKAHPEKVSAVTVGGKSAYKLPGAKPADSMFAAVLDESKIVVAPTENDLAGSFAAAAGTRKPAVSREFAGLMTTAKSNAPIFLRAWVKGKFNDLRLPNEKLKQRIQAIEWATAAIAVNKDVTLTVTVSAPDAAAAQQLSDLLGGLVGLVTLQMKAAAEDQPELRPVAELLGSTKVTPANKTVVAVGTVKGTSIEKALNPPAPAEPKKVTPKKK
ncbi:MAG TPA: hypothetical protein VKE40_09900 [Gemmataceae bacterium]|nr:hypothetical protein [Gemmataceae bacterium]